MPTTFSTTATGVSPIFTITAEEFLRRSYASVTSVTGDFVTPPTLGAQGGGSMAIKIVNEWYPWIDEKLVPPKYDGVCQWIGLASNRPTPIRDYHFISLQRAVDRLLAPNYQGVIKSRVTGVGPVAARTS